MTRSSLLVLLAQALVCGAFLALWEAASRLGWVDSEIIPPFSKVAGTALDLIRRGALVRDLGVTAREVGAAFLLSVPTGLLLGFLIGENARLRAVVMPVLQLVMAIPKAIFLPVFIIALGIGFAQKVVFGAMLAIFALILTGAAAVRSVPAGLVTLSVALGATRRQIYARIYLPAMLPLILEGVRLGLIFTIFGVLLAEMYGAQSGIGQVIFARGEQYRMTEFLACVLVVVVLTVALNEALRFLERLSAVGR